jgi:enamine deaminase RidA (YjgF/YER057c/UK114 family)
VSVRHVNPEVLHRSPAFSQAVVVERPAKTIYVSGRTASTPTERSSVPRSASKPARAFRNVATILESEGASLANIVYWAIAAVGGHTLDEGFAAFLEAWNPADPPPAITVHLVAGLGPEFLVKIDAVAIV